MSAASPRFGPLAPGQQRGALVAEVASVLTHLDDGAAVVVACSGGPDSTVLAYLVAEARPDLVLSIAHVRHGLRADREDLEVVTRHAQWLGVALDVREVEVHPDGHGVESAARDARYAMLRKLAGERGAAAILVGHTADDQAETVLLRLARGTGVDGLAAMDAVTGDVVRPLLRIRRADVERFLVLEGLPTVQDPMNEDPRVRRSIVRTELMEVLHRVADDPVGALVRLADLARDDRRVLDAAAVEPVASVRRIGPVRVLSDASLERLDPAIARRVVRTALAEVGQPFPDAQVVARVLELDGASAESLPGPIEVTAAGGWRALAPRSLPRSGPVDLAVPGVAVWSPAEVAVQAITADTDPWRMRPPALSAGGQATLELSGAWSPPPPGDDTGALPPGGRRERMVLTLPVEAGPFTVRHREPGDRVRTAAGTRSLQDVFVDAGVPRPVRELWPVVTTADGTVVWVPGITADDELLRAGRAAPAGQLRINTA